MKTFKLHGISKRYACRAALYRRTARAQIAGLDYSEAALRQLHDWESRGIGKVDKGRNGYAYGKWVVDLAVAMWVEDIQRGDAVKAEFLSTPLERLHNRSKLSNVQAATFFPYAERARA